MREFDSNGKLVRRRGHENKLRPGEVVMMRKYRQGGWSNKDLAFFFEMSESRVSEICRGKAYPDVGGPILKDKVHASGIIRRANTKRTPEIDRAILQLAAEGLSGARISARLREEFGVSLSRSRVITVIARNRRGC